MYIKYTDNIVIEVDDIIEFEKVYNSLVDPKPLKVLLEMGKYTTISSEARIYAAESSPKLIAIAYLIRGLSQRLLVKFYVRMWKRNKPYKFFQSFKEALEWLYNK